MAHDELDGAVLVGELEDPADVRVALRRPRHGLDRDGEQPAGVAAGDADAGAPDVDAESRSLAHPAYRSSSRRTASRAAGIADTSLPPPCARSGLPPPPPPSTDGHRLRERARVRSGVARGGRRRDDRERLAADVGARGRPRMPRRRASRARRSRASAVRRPSRACRRSRRRAARRPTRVAFAASAGNAIGEGLRLELRRCCFSADFRLVDELADAVDELLGTGLQARCSARTRAHARPRTAGTRPCRRATRRVGSRRRPTTRRRC